MGKLKFFFAGVLATLFFCVTTIPNIANASANTIIISVEEIVLDEAGSVNVPIRMSGNAGICGLVLDITFDEDLTLTQVNKGTALSAMTMSTTPLSDSKSFKIVYDSTEPDMSDGIIANLLFETPDLAGTYNIHVACANGNAVNGDLESVAVTSLGGKIIVSSSSQGGAEDTPQETPDSSGVPTLSLDRITVPKGEKVKIALRVSDNPGICGAAIQVTYDSRLVLSNIEQGDALKSLDMTVSEDMTLNPLLLLWDGVEADETNGVMALLTFTAPQTEGTYEIALSYADGNIVDGTLTPFNIATNDGAILVKTTNVSIQAGSDVVTLQTQEDPNGQIYVAYYDDDGFYISAQLFEPQSEMLKATMPDNTKNIKFMWWADDFTPLCDVKTVQLK